MYIHVYIKKIYVSPTGLLEVSVNLCGFLGALSKYKEFTITCMSQMNVKLLIFYYKRNKMNCEIKSFF